MSKPLIGRKALTVMASHGRSDWYRILNKADDSHAEIWLYDEIGWFGTDASEFVDELKDLDVDNITLRMNSRGGDVFDGIAIYNALRTHEARITVMVDSMAASIASVIAQAGDERIMVTGSQMMIHDAWGLAIGDAEAMRQYADVLDKQSGIIAGIYAERGDKSVDDYRDLMLAETWMTHNETVENGLADRILAPETQSDDNADTDADAAAAKVQSIAAMLRQAEEITL